MVYNNQLYNRPFISHRKNYTVNIGVPYGIVSVTVDSQLNEIIKYFSNRRTETCDTRMLKFTRMDSIFIFI